MKGKRRKKTLWNGVGPGAVICFMLLVGFGSAVAIGKLQPSGWQTIGAIVFFIFLAWALAQMDERDRSNRPPNGGFTTTGVRDGPPGWWRKRFPRRRRR